MYHEVLNKSDSIKQFYILGDRLGEGSFGVVRKAVRRTTGEEVAVKTIEKHKLASEELASLQLETEILSQIDHPNVVKTFEIFDESDRLYIVMEVMTGGELFDRIVEKDHYSEKEAADTIRPIVDAIKYCHEMGITHRDIKPENLLYSSPDPGALIKVSDFGLARYYDDELMTTACGTPSYVAPDILLGQGYTPMVDFWSIGIVLYIMLCGFPPFYEDTNEALFEAIKRGQFEFPSPFWDNISEMAKDLIRNCLQVDPERRFGADDILNHEWVVGHNTPRTNMPEVTEKLREYNVKRRFRKYANTAIASNKFIAVGKQARSRLDS